MRNIKLVLSYDGTDFSGWQRQPDRRTVQQVLEEAIGKLTGVEPSTNASGRTDAGVHALGQVVHFYTASRHAPEVIPTDRTGREIPFLSVMTRMSAGRKSPPGTRFRQPGWKPREPRTHGLSRW